MKPSSKFRKRNFATKDGVPHDAFMVGKASLDKGAALRTRPADREARSYQGRGERCLFLPIAQKTVFLTPKASKTAPVLVRISNVLCVRTNYLHTMGHSMDTNKRRTGIPIITGALIVAIVLLATSTVYFAYFARPGNQLATTSAVYSKAYSIPYVGNVIPASSGSSAQTGDPSSTSNTITVGGAGGVSYIPNEALVSVSVVSTGTTAGGTTSSNAVTTASVIKALNGIGVSNSSIETQGYSLNTNYANCYSSCVPSITGYTVTNGLQVNVTSSSPSQLGLQAGRVIDTSVGAGANQISLSFSETNSALAKLTNGALQQAVASASSQAQAIAGSLGVSITGVISASEGTSYTPYYGQTVFAAALNTVSTPILPGTQSMTVSVQVVYAIS